MTKNMKLGEVKNELLDRLTPFASTNGFKINKGQFLMNKKTLMGSASISFEHLSGLDNIQIQPYVEIKIDAIHNICEKHGFNLNYTAFINLFVLESVLNNTYTSDTQWKLQINQKERFSVHSIQDIGKIINRLIPMLDNAVNYINSNSCVESIDRMYNTDPLYEYNPNCSGMDTHCIIGLIAAKLNNNNYSHIREIYSNKVECCDFLESTKHSYFAIRDFLDEMDRTTD
jgi:hypothetical protein